VADAFYLPLSEGRFRATAHTNGPWNPGEQHAGPPAALLTREIERLAGFDDAAFARITVEILGPIPVGDLEVRGRLVRGGRAVRMFEAELVAGGRPAARATAWRHARIDSTPLAEPPTAPPPRPRPQPADATMPGGYLHAIDWAWTAGHFAVLGPAAVWTRLRHPLVDGEEPTPMQRLMTVADSGNGISGVAELGSWLYANTDLTVHLVREPAGEWVHLAAETTIGPVGSGLAAGHLSDEHGEVGRSAQALVVRPRPPVT
jgi:hypothetical protein